MISARLSILNRHVVPKVVNAAFQQRHILSLYNSNITVNNGKNETQPPTFVNIQVGRYMSTVPVVDTNEIRGMVSDGKSTIHETTQKSPGHVTRSLRVLDMDVVRKILDELKAVDVNADGR
jgi:hypothetical protein